MGNKGHYIFLIFIFTFTTLFVYASNDDIITALNKKSENIRTSDSKEAIAVSLKAVELANAGTNNSIKALSYKNLGVALYYHNAFQEALISYQNALKFYTELSDYAGISACFNNMAIIYKDLNSLEKSLSYYQKALLIDTQLKDKQSLAITYNNIGEIYHLQSKYILALQCYMLSLNYEQSLKNLNGIADSYLNIGAVMEENNFFDKALIYYKSALSLYEKTSNDYRLGQCYNNMGIDFTRLNGFYQAKDCFSKSLEIKKSINDQQGEVTTLINLGSLYILMNDSVKAKDYFIQAIYYDNNEAFKVLQKAEKDEYSTFQEVDDYYFYWISYNIEQGNYNGISQNLFFKGYIHFNLGEYTKAIGYFVNSLEIAEYQNIANTLKDNYLYLSRSYQHLNDFKNANFYAQQYISLSDSINSSMILDFMQLKQSMSPYFKLNNTPDKSISNQKSIFNDVWFIITLILSALLLIMGYKIFSQKSKENFCRKN